MRKTWFHIVRDAIVAGICGAIAIDLFLWIATVVPAGGSMLSVWQFIASTAVGKVAFEQPGYAALGLLMHLAVSIAWAGGYSYFTLQQPSTSRHWLVAGAAYGVVVYVLMQVILLGSGHFTPPPNPNAFVLAVIAHVGFFGIPVAYVVSRIQRTVSV